MNFSSYIGMFKMQFKSEMQYRGKAFSGVITQFFWGIMYIYLYTAFMRGGVDGFSLSQMATYIWLGQAFYSMRTISLRNDATYEITNGNVCYRFVKPLNIYNQWFVELAGSKSASCILRCVLIILITIWLPEKYGLSMPVSVTAFLLFLVALIVGFLLSVAISMFAYNLVFLTMSSKASFLINTIVALLNGSFIPVPLMPTTLQTVIKWLPFGCISDLSFRIYCGNIGLKDGLFRVGLGMVWLVVLIALGRLTTKKQLKNVVVQGG